MEKNKLFERLKALDQQQKMLISSIEEELKNRVEKAEQKIEEEMIKTQIQSKEKTNKLLTEILQRLKQEKQMGS
jgi:hypothetical protein